MALATYGGKLVLSNGKLGTVGSPATSPVAWVWPAEPGADSYVLQVGSSSGVYDKYDANVGNVLTYTLNLPAGTYYGREVPYTGVTPGAPRAERSVIVS